MPWYTIAEAAWLAGIVDGEGCIYLSYYEKQDMLRLRIVVRMTCEETIRKIKKIAGCGSIHDHQQDGNRKRIYVWTAGGKEAIFVLNIIKDYVVTKRKQTLLALEFGEKCNAYVSAKSPVEQREMGWKLSAQMTQLNHRGK